MAPPQSQPAAEAVPSDCTFQTILDFMLPFFLAGAGGDADFARAAIFELLDAYNAATTPELDLAGRIIIFSTAAMDNLRLSMSDPEMSDTKKLRYRSNAVALSRSAEQCRTVLEAMQAKRQATMRPAGAALSALAQAAMAQPVTTQPAMVGSPAPRPDEPAAQPAPPKPEASRPAVRAAQPAGQPATKVRPVGANQDQPAGADIERMKRDASLMIQALRASGSPLSAVADSAIADSYVPDPFAKAKAAAHAALAAAGIQPAATGTRC